MIRTTRVGSTLLRASFTIALAGIAAIALAGPRQNSTAAAGPKPAAVVTVKALTALIPEIEGWEKIRTAGDTVTVSDSCGYTFAAVTLMKDAMRVKVTVADTGSNADGLAMLATLVVSFPEDFTKTMPPATTIARFKINDQQAGSSWDDAKKEGEVTVVVGGRFVVSAYGSSLDSLDTLKAMVEKVDFKKLGDLK